MATRAPASRQPASTRPRAGSAGRTEGAGGGTRAGTGRPLWVLGGVAVVLALLILPYFQKWLVQRSEIQATRAAVAQTQGDVAALKAQQARWADEEYVKAQARARLHYVLPGEIGFVVVNRPVPSTGPADPSALAADVPVANRSWYSDVWLSAQVAGEPSSAAGKK